MSAFIFLRHLCIGLIVMPAMCVASGAVDTVPLPAASQAKIDAATWRRFQAGEVRELLVLFGDAAIDTEMQVQRAQRRSLTEDDVVRMLRAARYQQLKAPALLELAVDNAETRRDFRHIPMALVRFNNAVALQRLLARKEVIAVIENIKLYPVLTQSLSLIGQPVVAQVMGRTGAGTAVAVLDTGIDYTRSEFGSCTAPGVPAGCRVAAALDFAPNDSALDSIGHGTQVAGVVAATAPGASLLSLDVFDGGSASSSDIIDAIDWVIANKSVYNIAVINLSLGDGVNHTSTCTSLFSNPFRQPIIEAQTAGVVTVAASGNETYTNGLANPACTPEAVSVGAVYDANVGGVGYSACSDASSAADKVACFSNSASFLTLLAPGALMTTAGVTTAGTSLAAPMVSGAVAVLAAAFPLDTPAQRIARLTGSGKPVTDARNSITKPRLDLLAAQGAPANNAFASAVMLSGTSGLVSGWNFNATLESGEPAHAGVGGGKSVWWQWTAPSSGTVTLDTHGSGFNTLLAVYTGAAPNALTAVASNDDDGAAGNTSGLSFHSDAGVTYRIAVDGNAGAQGAIVLNRAFTTDLLLAADLAITLTDVPDPVQFGASMSYTMTVNNLSAVAAQSVVATLNLPAGVTFASAVGCIHSLGVVTCAFGTVAGGQQMTRDVQVTPQAIGAIQGQATVSSATADPDTANNAVVAVTTVYQSGSDPSGDVPLPAWALVLLAAVLWCSIRWGLRGN